MTIDIPDIKAGDTVSVALTDGTEITGPVVADCGGALMIAGGYVCLYTESGVSAPLVASIDSHTPGIPAHLKDAAMSEPTTAADFDALPDGTVLVVNPDEPEHRYAYGKNGGRFTCAAHRSRSESAEQLAREASFGDRFIVVWTPGGAA